LAEPNQTQSQLETNRKPCVLLVEDDDNMRMVLSMILSKEQYEVIEAHDGQDALDKLTTVIPDIIVSDMMMPRMDGNEMVSIVRRHAEMRTIPILMLTAADTEDNELRILEHGANDFVSKTADKRILLARITKLLEMAR